jgi:hypothetical protein
MVPSAEQGFSESFESAEYMHIKNSILVLTKVAPYFPLDYAHGSKLDASLTALLATEKPSHKATKPFSPSGGRIGSTALR